MQSLVVDILIEVLNINVRRVGTTNSRVTGRPHYAARLTLDVREVQCVQSALSILDRVKVNISVAKGAASHAVAAHANASNWSNCVEDLVQNVLGNVCGQITNIQGSKLGR